MKHKFEYVCKDYENIENYWKAKADNFVGWVCHHRLETHTSDGERRLVDITVEELIALGTYYNRPASELIFMTKSEHGSLHQKGKKGKPQSEEQKRKKSEALKGRQFSEEHRKKLSEAAKRRPEEYYKGENNRFYGKHHSEEAKMKMSIAHKNISDETRKKMSENQKGKHWYNNGIKCIKAKECPEGFVPGRIKNK